MVVVPTVPPAGARDTDGPKPEPLAVDTSKCAGAVTIRFAVKSVPATVKVCSVELLPTFTEPKSTNVPVSVITGAGTTCPNAKSLSVVKPVAV